MEVYSLSVLEELEAESIYILREAAGEFGRTVMLCSDSPESCVLLRLAQKAFAPGRVPFSVLDVGRTEGSTALRAFRDRVSREARVEWLARTGGDALHASPQVSYDALIASTRRDETRADGEQRVFSLRDAGGRRHAHGERPEFWNLYNTRLQSGERMHVHPLFNWTGIDLQRYLEREGAEIPPEDLASGSARPAAGNRLRFVVAGAGGSGKSALAEQLLCEDRRQFTLASGTRYLQFSTSERRFLLIDAPGEEARTCDMAAAASHADLAVLLIDAQRGTERQTHRHAFICSLLGIPRLLVAVNKMDLVGYAEARFREIREDFETFVTRLGFKSLAFVPLSARTGDNVSARGTEMGWYNGPALLEHLDDVYVGGDRNLVDFRLAVQSIAKNGDGRWYGGQIGSGVVKVGDEVAVVPSHRRSRVRKLALHDDRPERAFAPLSASICLEDEIDVGRGALLAHPANMPRAVRSVDVLVLWVHGRPLRAGQTYLLRHAAGWVRASCAAINYRIDPDSLHRSDAGALQLNDIGRAMFTLFEERFVDAYARNRSTGCLLVVDADDGRTLGAAVIVDRESEHGRVRARKAAERVVVPHIGKVSETARSVLLHQRARTIWLTGLSGSGKSTLATELERELVDLGHACFMLDGDNVRGGLNRDLGFGPDDRSENIRRIAEVARLMNDAGLVAITAFISPYREDRDMARKIIGAERYIEVYLDASLDACEKRDPKGLYRKARAGEIPEFTGVTAPYEPPQAPALTLDTAGRSVEECTAQLLAEVLDRIRIG